MLCTAGSSACNEESECNYRSSPSLIASVDHPNNPLSCFPFRITLSVFYISLFWSAATYSQRSQTSLRALADTQLRYTPIGLAAGLPAPNRTTEIVVLSQEDKSLHFYNLNKAGSIVLSKSFKPKCAPGVIARSRVDSDGTVEFVVLSTNKRSVSIVRKKGGSIVESVMSLDGEAERLIVADVNNDKRNDILLFGKGSSGVSTLTGRRDGTYAPGIVLFPDLSVSDLKTTDLNGDGITDILLLDWLSNELVLFYGIGRGIFSEQVSVNLAAEPAELGITQVTKGRKIRVAVTLPEDSEAERLIVADVNNDKRNDILLFGKGSSGVSTLTGRRDGTYAPGIVLFPELSVSDLKTTDLNGDGITDILLLDWLSNELVLFYGIGRGIFSEQVSVNLAAEPAELGITQVTKGRKIRVAVTLPEDRRISVFTGNTIGEFEEDWTMTIDGTPVGITFAHLNNDHLPDLISSTDKGILVFLSTSMTQFSIATVFGVWNEISSWAVFDVDGDKKEDLVLTDKLAKRLILVCNADYSGFVNWPYQYSVGKSPRGLTASDFDGNGFTDIAVVNSMSSSLSILLNNGNGRMDGQRSVPLPENPVFVKTVSSPHTRKHTLITTHSNVDRIVVVELDENIRTSNSFTIPTSSNPYVLFAKEDPVNKQLEVLVRNTNPEDGSLSLSMFEQIGHTNIV